MSDASQAQLFFVEETTWGETPSSALDELRFTSESLKQAEDSARSNEIRSDRMVTDILRTSIRAEGDVNYELSFLAFRKLWEGLLMNDITTAVAISGTDIGADNGNSEFTSSTTDFTAENIEVGQWLKVGGFTDTTINGFYKVTSIATNALGVIPAPATEASGNTITMDGSMIKNAQTEKSYTLEKKFVDVTEFIAYKGMRVARGTATITPGSLITGTFGFLGKSAVAAGSSVGTGPANSAPTNKITNSIDNVKGIFEGGALSTLDLTEISFDASNNLRNQPAIGTLGNIDIGLGRFTVTGSFIAYFESRTLYEKFLNNTETDLAFRIEDADGNAIYVDFPRIKFTDADVVVGGNDQDVLAQMRWESLRDATDQYMMAMNFVPA